MARAPQPRPNTIGPSTGPAFAPIPTVLSELQRRVKTAYANKCVVPPTLTIPDNNPYFNRFGLTRQSFLDLFLEQLIRKGFSPQFATELGTGKYGIESTYGQNTGCTGSFCGPLQMNQAFYTEWFVKAQDFDPHPGDYLNPFVQIIAVAYAAWDNYHTLLDLYPSGTWRADTIEPFDVYMMHQQGQFGYPKILAAGPDKIISKVVPSGYKQYGFGQGLYNANSTVERFLQVQESAFLASAARGGLGDCGEFAVRFYAGAT